MRGRVQKVRSTHDRVRLIIRRIKQGKLSENVHIFVAMAVTDFSGTDWAIKPKDWAGEVCAIADFIQANVINILLIYA